MGLDLSKTKYNPKVAAAKRPQIVPIKILFWGEFITLFESVTAKIIPNIANIEVIIVGLLIFSFKIKNEKKDANNGPVAMQNNISATEELAIPSVKKMSLLLEL